MRVRLNKRLLRRDFINHPHAQGLVCEGDVRVTPRGRLHAKVLVFDKPRSLRRFWRKVWDVDLTSKCLGAVSGLSTEHMDIHNGTTTVYMKCDPRYFCVVGLCKGHLGMEIVCHEAVHAGTHFAERHRDGFWQSVGGREDENVAYPAGRIAAGINRMLWKEGLYDE